MRIMTFEEVKKVELEILSKVADFCEKNNLRYFLAYGTLIGAVRHGGFIPWDDDIDIWMPRKDYNLFLKDFNREDNRYLAVSPYDDIACHSMTKVIDTKTVKMETGIKYKNGNLGVDVDIFPIDGEPQSDKDFSKWYKKLYRQYQNYYYLICDPKAGKRNFVFSLLVRLSGKKKSDFIKKAEVLHEMYPYEKSRFVGAVETMHNSPKNRFKKEWFEESITINFENCRFKIPICYDEILKQMYGDYMTLPPEDKQVTHHSNINYWLED